MKLKSLWICAGSLFLAQLGLARVEDTCEYSKAQVYRSALRFLRVDQRLTISEKDEESGYFLFDYPVEKETTTPASLEIIESEAGVKIVVSITRLPEYHERHFVAKFLEKLRTDYGDVPKAAKKRPKATDGEKEPPADEPEQPDKPGAPSEAPPEPKGPTS